MDNKYLENYYNNYDEEGRLISKHGSVEFLTTMKYIEKYLKSGMKILDIGAGTGRYSRALADISYSVDAIELVQSNIDIFKSKIKDNANITIQQGNAIDISFIESNKYDITLLLGPMYHLYNKKDREKALSEALRVTKPNGIIFVAYCMMDATILNFGFINNNILDLVDKNMLDTNTFVTHSDPCDIFELYRKENILKLTESLNVERLNYVASDGYTNHMRETIDNMDEKTFALYLKYHYAMCEREDMQGLSHHTLDILRKKA